LAFTNDLSSVFNKWKNQTTETLKNLVAGCKPKQVIQSISEALLHAYDNRALIDQYDVYQHLMSYWSETMQDDIYVIATDGWKAGNEVNRLAKESKNSKKETVRKDVEGLDGLEGRLIPPSLLIAHYFAAEQNAIDALNAKKEEGQAIKTEIEEEQGVEGGLFGDLDKINKAEITKLLKEKKGEKAPKEEIALCETYLKLLEQDTKINADLKVALKALENKVVAKYPTLTETEIKTLVTDHKWMHTIATAITTEMERVSQALTLRIKELVDRYDNPMPQLKNEVETLEEKVNAHLTKMGLVW
jgi:type I restriction enzyme M protein